MMPSLASSNGVFGHWAWLDLATRDAKNSERFYQAMFGWHSRPHSIGSGIITRFSLGNTDVGSLYQLSQRHLAAGVPSHWTPYVAVPNAEAACTSAKQHNGHVVVPPFNVPGAARIALLQDPVGALFGVWQPASEESCE